jgi:cholesterol oxidase
VSAGNIAHEAFDFIIVGSGFGGSVSAMRLAQKGYRVAVVEAGKRWQASDFPKSNWNAFKYFWAPRLRCFGIQNITLLKGVMVLHGSGVGGGRAAPCAGARSSRRTTTPRGACWA